METNFDGVTFDQMSSAGFLRSLTRRALLKSSLVGLAEMAMPSMSPGSDTPVKVRKGRIRQSVSRWCYQNLSLDELAAYAHTIGLKGIDLLQPEEYEIPRRYELICTMGYGGGGEIGKALNRVENHAAIEQGFRENIPRAEKAGVPNVITFSVRNPRC